ncbi:MAG: flagellin [Planctomycetaceae bacterium]
MTRINTNVASLRGLRNLEKANNLLGTSLARLSTGLQINSGKDNPSGLIASETLRSQISAIEQSIKNSNRANNVISTADSALGEISGLLNQIRGLVQEGLNSGALSQSEIEANQQQIDTALSAINRIAANTSFAGERLIDGSKAFTTQVSAANAAKLSDFQIDGALFGGNGSIEVNAQVVSAAKKGELRYSGGNLSSAATIEVAGAKGNQLLFLGGSSTVANVRDAVNSVSDVTGVSASISNAGAGSLTVSNAEAGSLFAATSTPVATLTTAGTIDVSRDARAGFTQFDSQEGDALLTFTDERATSTVGDAGDLGGELFIELVNTQGNLANSVVDSVSVAANGDTTITINLADDGTDSIATLADIQAAIAAHSGASSLISASATGVAGDTFAAAGATQLTGGQNTTDNDVTFTDARPVADRGTYDVAVQFVDPGEAGAALSIAVTTDVFGNKTVQFNLETDANGNIVSTADDIADILENGVGAEYDAARDLLTATASGDGSGVVAATLDGSDPTSIALSNVSNSHLTFTDGRYDSAGATFDDALEVEMLNGGVSQTLSVSFTANGDGGKLTVNLATDADGNVTSTAEDIAALVASTTTDDINTLFQVQASGNGSGVVQAFAADELEPPAGGADADLTFTDARATDSQGEFDTSVSVQMLNGGANQSLSVSVSQDSNGNKSVTINLATDADGNVTSTAGDIAAFIADDDSAGATEARALVDVEASGDGTGVVKAKALAALTGGSDGANDDVTFTDIRTGDQTQGISVAFVNAGADEELGVTVGLDGDGNHLITVNLATDSDGNVTSTSADIVAFLNTDGGADTVTARGMVSAEAAGDGSGVVAAREAALLSESDGDDVLVFTSDNYGSRNFVQVNVLSGAFATTLDDGETAANRNAGADIGVRINGQDALGKGLKASVKTATLEASLTIAEGTNAAGESVALTITGGGSLFQIGQDASIAGQIGIGIEAINTARLGGVSGKLFELGSGGGKSLFDVGPGVQGSALVSIVEEAIERVSNLRGRLGSIQKNVIETNSTSLGVALENISEARSQILDTDFAVETANLTKAQILSQAGLSVLGIANQSPAQVLSLLG